MPGEVMEAQLVIGAACTLFAKPPSTWGVRNCKQSRKNLCSHGTNIQKKGSKQYSAKQILYSEFGVIVASNGGYGCLSKEIMRHLGTAQREGDSLVKP